MGPQPVAEAERDQGACRVGGELDAGAGFLEPLGLLEHDRTKPVSCQRQRRGQSGDTGACDDDDARGRQGTRSGAALKPPRSTRIRPAARRPA